MVNRVLREGGGGQPQPDPAKQPAPAAAPAPAVVPAPAGTMVPPPKGAPSAAPAAPVAVGANPPNKGPTPTPIYAKPSGKKCPVCGGKGEVKTKELHRPLEINSRCAACNGTGDDNPGQRKAVEEAAKKQ